MILLAKWLWFLVSFFWSSYNGIKDMAALQLGRLPSLKALFLQGNVNSVWLNAFLAKLRTSQIRIAHKWLVKTNFLLPNFAVWEILLRISFKCVVWSITCTWLFYFWRCVGYVDDFMLHHFINVLCVYWFCYLLVSLWWHAGKWWHAAKLHISVCAVTVLWNRSSNNYSRSL